MIKLIATDLDGTLLYPKRRIRLLTRKNKRFLKNYILNGNEVVLVSGRNQEICGRIAKRIGCHIDMIACNGSLIIKDGEIFDESPLDHNQVKALFESQEMSEALCWCFMTSERNLIIVVSNLSILFKVIYRIAMFAEFGFEGTYKIGKKYYDEMINNPEIKIYKAMCIWGLGKKAQEKAHEKCEYAREVFPMFEPHWSHTSIEFTNKGVSKSQALKKLIAASKLEENEVAVVGDSGNDVPLFEEFENSFVMKKAHDDIKGYAKYIIDGVYEIQKYIEEKF